MGVHGGPDIVEDGLVFYIDAANGQSYPGSGTTANTLLGTSNATLNGGVTFDSANLGNFNCDGVDDYIQTQIPDPGNQATVDLWIKRDYSHVSGNSKMICAWRYYSIYNDNGRMGFNTGAGDIYGLSKSEVTALNINNVWTNWTFFWNSNVSYTNNKIYINGELQSISQVTGTEAGGNRNFNSGNFGIACWNVANTPGYFATMEIASAKIYNKELSASEVLQNYNAVKERFGL